MEKETNSTIAELLAVHEKKGIIIKTELEDEYNNDDSPYTVKDLIDALSNLDPNLKVVIHTSEFGANTIRLVHLVKDKMVQLWPW